MLHVKCQYRSAKLNKKWGAQWNAGALREAFSLRSSAVFVKQSPRMCKRALWGIHPACVNAAAQGSGYVTACHTRWRYGWFNGAPLRCVLHAAAAARMRLLVRGRLYDSQIMTHSSLWLQLSGFQQTPKLLNQTSHQRARSSAKSWRKQASQRCSGSSSV